MDTNLEKDPNALDDLVELEIDAEEGQAAPAGDIPQADPDPEPEHDAAEEPEARAAAEPPDEGEDDEEEPAAGESASDRMTRRQRAKERRRLARERQEMELAQLRADNLRLQAQQAKAELRFMAFQAQQESARIDQQAAGFRNEYQRWQKVKADAISSNDGSRVVQADHKLTEIQQAYEGLRGAKTRTSEGLNGLGERLRQVEAYEAQIAQGVAPQSLAQGGQGEAEPPALTSDGQKMARDFLDSMPWYRRGARTGDSRAVETIDMALMAEGFDPNTREYWDEFKDRLRIALPKRFEKPKNGGPPVSAGRDVKASAKSTVRIPREALETMRQAGYIDEQNKVVDRTKVNAYLQRFRAAEKAARAG
jgi:hypothetical protein